MSGHHPRSGLATREPTRTPTAASTLASVEEALTVAAGYLLAGGHWTLAFTQYVDRWLDRYSALRRQPLP